jgi:shikimate dehydrogenase
MTNLAAIEPITIIPDVQAKAKASTRLMGLLGEDVRHADLAFSFNNRMLSVWGSEFLYVPYSVPVDRLKDAVRGIRALDILSCNVTFPHKVSILEYMDEVEETAQLAGAANLVVNRGSRLYGHNTDGQGFLDALLETGMMGDLDSALIYGAGGAGRAVAAVLAAAGMPKIWMYDIIDSRSAEVEARLGHKGSDASAVRGEQLVELRPALIVNATPLGRGGEAHRSPLGDLSVAECAVLFFDLNYNPPKSRFLLQAEGLGIATENGLRMMCYQAKRSIEIAAGKGIPFEWFCATMESEGLIASLVCAEDKDGNGDVWRDSQARATVIESRRRKALIGQRRAGKR